MIRVLLAEDNPMVRRGLRMRLELEPDVEVIGEAADGQQAADLASTLCPDVLLMDIFMPHTDGIEALISLRAAGYELPVVLVSLYDDAQTMARAVAAGATAFVAKANARESLPHVLRRITHP